MVGAEEGGRAQERRLGWALAMVGRLDDHVDQNPVPDVGEDHDPLRRHIVRQADDRDPADPPIGQRSHIPQLDERLAVRRRPAPC